MKVLASESNLGVQLQVRMKGKPFQGEETARRKKEKKQGVAVAKD